MSLPGAAKEEVMESLISKENYINIQGWMVTELNLKGNELIIYACIYGFSQAEGQAFSGRLKYLADWTNSTKYGVTKCLKSLIEKGYIVKDEEYINNVKCCKYRTVNPDEVCNKVDHYATKLYGGMQQSCTEYATKLHGGMQQSCTNDNIDNNKYNNTNNINNNTSTESKTDTSEPKPASSKLTHEQEFERLWNCYPAGRKQGRKKAYACYLRARRSGTSYSEVMEGLKAYLRQITIEKTDIQFVKQGGTWFSGECWKDEYNSVPPSDGGKRPAASNGGRQPAALAYEQRSYSIEELKALGVDFGEDVYDA